MGSPQRKKWGDLHEAGRAFFLRPLAPRSRSEQGLHVTGGFPLWKTRASKQSPLATGSAAGMSAAQDGPPSCECQWTACQGAAHAVKSQVWRPCALGCTGPQGGGPVLSLLPSPPRASPHVAPPSRAPQAWPRPPAHPQERGPASHCQPFPAPAAGGGPLPARLGGLLSLTRHSTPCSATALRLVLPETSSSRASTEPCSLGLHSP